jgi:ESX secretion-associated protein EspG
MSSGAVVLSRLEFDVLWEREELPRRHVAIEVESPGATHTERRALVAETMGALDQRGLAKRDRAVPELADWLNLLAHPQVCVDTWVWTADRTIRSLTAASGSQAVLAVVDGPEVWLIPVRDSAVAEAAVSVAGDTPPGAGYSVNLETSVLLDADQEAGSDPREFALALGRAGVATDDADVIANMTTDMQVRGQFGATRRQRDQRMRRADRVVCFHDTPYGRYLYLARANNDGRQWTTITPADNRRLVTCVEELLDEV